MGFINSLPGPFVTASIQSLENTMNDYNQITGQAWTELTSVQCKIQLGSMAQSVVSDKYKAIVSAVLLVDPEDLSLTITDDNKIVVSGKDYSVLYVDNIEDISIEIPLKLWEA